MLESCLWVREGMEKARPPALLRATKGALFFCSGIRFKSANNPQSSRLLSCALSPTAWSPSLGRLSELCSPGLCLHSEKPVASPSHLKRPPRIAVPHKKMCVCNVHSGCCCSRQLLSNSSASAVLLSLFLPTLVCGQCVQVSLQLE